MNPRELLKRILAADGRVDLSDPQRPRLRDVPPALAALAREHREALRELIRREGVPKLSRVEREVYRTGAWMPPER